MIWLSCPSVIACLGASFDQITHRHGSCRLGLPGHFANRPSASKYPAEALDEDKVHLFGSGLGIAQQLLGGSLRPETLKVPMAAGAREHV